MKKKLKGFTIIEVSLFLAITGLIFLGVTFGVQSSVFRQRFNDSVQSFAEFLRSIYAETMNVQNAEAGRSQQAIYGKLVTFGEEYGFTGNKVNGNQAFMYDIVGEINKDIGSGGDVLDALKAANADVAIKEAGKTPRLAGIVESFQPKWSSQIQQACTSPATCFTQPIKAALLIVRHPRSGTVYTYVMKNKTIPVNDKMRTLTASQNILKSYLTTANFKREQIDFCVNPEGNKKYDNRANVRITANARNSSAIEIIYEVGSKPGDNNNCR